MNVKVLCCTIGFLLNGYLSGMVFLDPYSSGIQVNPSATLTNQGTLNITGVLNNDGTIAGSPITFTDGTYTNGIYDIYLTGQYNPSLANPLYLNGSATFNAVRQGSIATNVTVNGANNLMEGSPSFANANAIQLNSEATLTLALLSELNQNIVLNSDNTNVLTLGADLSLGDGVFFSGPGTINLNGHNLILGNKLLAWTNPLTLISTSGPANFAMNAEVQLTSLWTFANGSDVHIVGNNEILDVTSGTISIGSGTTVTMSNLTLNGLGSGQILFADSTSTLVLQNVNIILNQSVIFTIGNVTVIGPSTIVVANNFLTFSGTSLLTVDGAALEYDPLTYNDQNNIVFGSSANEVLSNGGSIRKTSSLKLGSYVFDADPTLDQSYVVALPTAGSGARQLIIDADTAINGAGFSYQFALYAAQSLLPNPPPAPIFTVAPGVSMLFTNITLQNLPIYNNSFGTGSQVIFGDQTTVQLGTSGTLTDTWMFSGRAVLTSGAGNALQLGTTARLILRPGTSLLIDNITISGIQGNNIYCMDDTCTISFGNVTWVQSNTFTLTQSHIELVGSLDIQGTSTFVYASDKASIITNLGNLYVDSGMTFSYAPRIANRDLITMKTSNAALTLNNATLASTTTGMRLTNGTINIAGTCYMVNDNAVALSEGIAFGNGTPANDVTVNFGAGATLNPQSGLLVYENQF